MGKDAQERDTGTEVAIMSPALIEQFARMATLVPSEDGAGYERIIEQILAAPAVENLDDAWETSKAEKLVGKMLRIDSITRRPSDYKQGLGVFLVARCIDTSNGEEIVVTTGSVAVVAQLVRAYALNGLPVYAEFVIAERPTEAGYRPHHLRFYGPPPTE